MEINTLKDLLEMQLQGLYSIENQLIDSLPLMVNNAESPDLRNALQNHLEVTRQQLGRLEEIGTEDDITLMGHSDEGMRNLLAQEQELLQSIKEPEIKDSAIMAGAGKVEHYEMAAYESALNLARKLGRDDMVEKLEKTYSEEKKAAAGVSDLESGGILGKIADAL